MCTFHIIFHLFLHSFFVFLNVYATRRPYSPGGLNFLIATVLLVYTSYEARYGEPGRADRRRVARKHPFLGAETWTLRAAVGRV